MPNFWQSNQIRLRAIEPTDAETFHHWNEDSDRARFLDFLWPPASLAATIAWTAEASKKRLENDAYHWLIETLDPIAVGSIASHDCDPHSGVFSYGIDIAPEFRRKGYASQAISLVLRYYFDQLRYQKCTVQVHSDNLASLALHEKLGFQREGVLRRMAYQNGQYLDAIYLGLTIEEFHALSRSGRQFTHTVEDTL